jgi:predicted transglutaminase-like cysteine proteinase
LAQVTDKEKSGSAKRVGFNYFLVYRHVLFSCGLTRVFGIGALFLGIVASSAHAHDVGLVAHWTMPAIGVAEADQPKGPNIFGTIALPVRPKQTSTRWAKVMLASLDQPALVRLAADARQLPPQDQAAFVQSAVNHAVRSNTGDYDCSDNGYWRPAEETLARGTAGCFDIAIAKMEALRLLGFPEKDLYLTTGYFHTGLASTRSRESVALLVSIGESFLLLPEQSAQIIETGSLAGDSTEFAPVLTYGVGMTWVHGRVVKIASLDNGTGGSEAK